jgi:predicted metal-dependent enzyme (double-stranded beta helix superfamily)
MHNLTQLFRQMSNKTINASYFNVVSFRPILQNYIGVDWKQKVEYDNNRYNRVHLYSHEMFDAYLLCWLPGQYTNTHNHSRYGCISKILQGSLVETRVNGDLKKENILKTESILTINNDRVYHNMGNKSEDPAISLHIYGKNDYL